MLTAEDKEDIAAIVAAALEKERAFTVAAFEKERAFTVATFEKLRAFVAAALEKERAFTVAALEKERAFTTAAIERVETALLTAFHAWASPTDQKLRSHREALRALDLQIEEIASRVRKLEDAQELRH